MKLKHWLYGLSFFTVSICWAEDAVLSPAPAEIASKTYTFSSLPGEKQNVGKLTLLEEKTNVKLQFEGTRLKKGTYKLGIAETCTLSKGQKRVKLTKDLHKFTTESGEIYTEENLSTAKIGDLGIENHSIVLIKIERNQDKLLGCGI